MATQTKVIGPISAYAIAVQEGYTGSKAEWAEAIGNAQENAQIAQEAADRAQSLTESLPQDFTDTVANFAPTYSPSTSYAVGDYVIHNGLLYICKTAIASGESWTSGHWTQVNVGRELENKAAEISDLRSATNQLDTEIYGEDPNIPITDLVAGYMNSTGGIIGNNSYKHGFADVSTMSSVIVDSTALSDTVIINVCNQNKEFIRNIVSWGAPNEYVINVTDGDYYVCISAKVADLPNVSVRNTEVSNDNILARLGIIERDNSNTADDINNVAFSASKFEKVNFFKHYNIVNAYIDINYTIKSNANNKTVCVKLLPNTLYCLSVDKKPNTDMRAALYNAEPVSGLIGIDAGYAGGASPSFYRTFSTTGDYVYLAIKYWVTGVTTYTEQEVLDSIKIEISNGCVTADIVSKLNNAKHIPSNAITPLTLVHFSDIHADTQALKRITTGIDALDASVDDSICTGDIVGNTGGEIASWWNPKILTCIGNHDSATYSGGAYNWTAISMANRDAYYIAPFESNWSVTHTAGTSYYYKDYTAQKVRLIVMDVMLYNDNGAEATAQTAWLDNLLADAITNGLHVLIAIHAPHGGATAEDCSFSKYEETVMPTNQDCNTPQSVIDAVAAKITNGLHFVGYLVGHTHQDNIWDSTDDGKQLMYCITCAAVTQTAQWIKSDQFRDAFHDAYNIVTVDTANTLVKIVRAGGADIDDHMRTRKAICFNYSTGQKVGEVL